MTTSDIHITKHALKRYTERFGFQTEKVLKDRFLKAKPMQSNSKEGHSIYGRIIFVYLSNGKEVTVLSVKKAMHD